MNFIPVENITMRFPSSEEGYTQEQMKRIGKIQNEFKYRKQLMEFSYFIGKKGYIIQVFWLNMKKLLLFKIYVDSCGEKELMHDLRRDTRRVSRVIALSHQSDQSIGDELDKTIIEMANRVGSERILFQELKINLEELLPDLTNDESEERAKLKR